MTAQSKNVKRPRRGSDPTLTELGAMPVAAAAHLFVGAMLALNLAGNIVRASADPTLFVLGQCDTEVDNSTGSAGDETVIPRRGVYRYENSGSTDALTDADVGRVCYVVDDQTVARTSAFGVRPIAGKVALVDSYGVWVEVGQGAAGEGNIDLLVPAGADLSSSQYLAVVLGSGGTVTALGTAGGDGTGILQNAPASGAIARVRIAGFGRWITASAVTVGALLESNSSGQAIAAVTGRTDTSDSGAANDPLKGGFVLARALSAGGTATAAQVYIQPMGAIPQTAV